MKNRWEEFRGTGAVARFTFRQTLRAPANRIGLFVLVLLSALSIPFLSLLSGRTGAEQEPLPEPGYAMSAVDTLYLINETDTVLTSRLCEESGMLFAEKIIISEETMPEVIARMGGEDIAIRLYSAGDVLYAGSYAAAGTSLSREAVYDMTSAVQQLLRREALAQLGIGQLPELTLQGAAGERENSFEQHFTLQMGYSMLVMFLSVFSVSYIVKSVLEEKTSKLVDTLLLSVRPAALVMGKILASMAYVFLMVISMLAAATASSFACRSLFDDPRAGILGLFAGLQLSGSGRLWQSLALMLPCLLLGYVFYAMLSGLCGAACSRSEESDRATLLPMALIMLGYLVATIGVAFDITGVHIALSLFPVTAVFAAPVRYMSGQIPLWTMVLSILLLLGCTGLLCVLCGRVYGILITHKGSRIRFREIAGIYAANRAEAGKGGSCACKNED